MEVVETVLTPVAAEEAVEYLVVEIARALGQMPLVAHKATVVDLVVVPYKVVITLPVVVVDIMVVVVGLIMDHILQVLVAVQDIMEDTPNYLYQIQLVMLGVMAVTPPAAPEVQEFLVIFQELLVMDQVVLAEEVLLVVFVLMLYLDLEVKLFKY